MCVCIYIYRPGLAIGRTGRFPEAPACDWPAGLRLSLFKGPEGSSCVVVERNVGVEDDDEGGTI